MTTKVNPKNYNDIKTLNFPLLFAMALSMSLTKATTASPHNLKLLLKHTMAIPFSSRAIHTIETNVPDIDATTKKNPFQTSGPGGSYTVKHSSQGISIRVLMPGVDKDSMRFRVNRDSFYFIGKAPKESKHEETARTYSGNIDLHPGFCHMCRIRGNYENGVLSVFVLWRRPGESSKIFPISVWIH